MTNSLVNEDARQALDTLINKARVHFYKPIQVAEILYYDRVVKPLNFENLESYRNESKKWRDQVCQILVGRVSTSSAKYQDDLFTESKIPPILLKQLSIINKESFGGVEKYIYSKFFEKFNQLSRAINYCDSNNFESFNLLDFINLFELEPGLKRSLDKIYEIIVYALFSSLVEALEINITIQMRSTSDELMYEFKEFTNNILNLNAEQKELDLPAKIFRVGLTNAADKGLDMWANFGMAIQIKHLSLTQEVFDSIADSITADKIIIVCKAIERKSITNLLQQIGWQSRINSIITEKDLIEWYEKALNGKFSSLLGHKILEKIKSQILLEFPATDNSNMDDFFANRDYGFSNLD